MQNLLSNVRSAAHGRWAHIHSLLGIDPRYLNPHKHCPCPACGGRDRFRYTDHKGEGGYICNQCGAGSGFDLLMIYHGYDFKMALHEVAGVLGMERIERRAAIDRPPPLPSIPKGQDQAPRLAEIWRQGLDMQRSEAIADYLQGRGLSPHFSPALRFLPAFPYWYDGEKLGDYPAMLARISDAQGELQGLHLTYLQSQYARPMGENGAHIPRFSKLNLSHRGETLPAKKMRVRLSGAIKGAAVQLFPPQDGVLALAEGIESAFAAHELFGLPTWACLSAYGMRSFLIPEGIRQLVIIADNDANGTGQKAARALELRALKAGLEVRTWQPPTIDSDALDFLVEKKGLSA